MPNAQKLKNLAWGLNDALQDVISQAEDLLRMSKNIPGGRSALSS